MCCLLVGQETWDSLMFGEGHVRDVLVWELEVSEALADPEGGYADSWRGRPLASLRLLACLLAWSFTTRPWSLDEGRVGVWVGQNAVAGSAFGIFFFLLLNHRYLYICVGAENA